MKTETLFDVASLGLRAAEAALRRRRPPASTGPDTRPDRLVRRALPVASNAAGDLLASEDSWLQDLVRPLALMAMGRNRAGDAALAAAISGAAGSGWALSVPSGRGTYEIEMARANPRAHILCLSNKWDVL